MLLVNCSLSLVDGRELDECEIDGLLLLEVDALDGAKLSEIFLQVVLADLGHTSLTELLRLET